MGLIQKTNRINYGRLTILGEPYRKNTGNNTYTYVKAKCECGVVKEFRKSHIVDGLINSCGCLRKEISIKRFTTHGLSKNHPLYGIWLNIKNRCYNKNVPAYKYYGERGITH